MSSLTMMWYPNKVMKMIRSILHIYVRIVFTVYTSSHQAWMKMNPFLSFMASNLMSCLYLVIFSDQSLLQKIDR